MRIFDEENNKVLSKVTLLLKENEARELLDDLISLLENMNEHVHINDLLYEHEITVAVYDENDFEEFNERIKQVIKLDN
ncbi:hypothetical protein ACFSTH_09415 [Paenibacillus yanchengensis]|uniref:Uncharacterized protein n=1 Tax=Paenibacillus yanchengensis TaxID=2035833 RepID=A0ABW4YPW7_9BACL